MGQHALTYGPSTHFLIRDTDNNGKRWTCRCSGCLLNVVRKRH